MSITKLTCTAILSAAALVALPVLASARPKPTNETQIQKTSISLDSSAKVDGTTLAPGKYEVVIDGKKVSFERDDKTVVTAPCDWKTLQYKSQYNSTTLSANNQLQEIEFEGSNKALEVM